MLIHLRGRLRNQVQVSTQSTTVNCLGLYVYGVTSKLQMGCCRCQISAAGRAPHSLFLCISMVFRLLFFRPQNSEQEHTDRFDGFIFLLVGCLCMKMPCLVAGYSKRSLVSFEILCL
ncbi:hypothetical protein M758_11G085400 [Ceratodon purpureus]|nr:hypothetical protein M758_11G085400 [Ceratodon purpureus]